MHVLLTMSSLQVGGAERNVVSLLPHLIGHGVRVDLCTLGTVPDSFLARHVAGLNVERFDLGARRLIDPPAFARYVSCLRRLRPDVVHGQDQYGSLFAAAACRMVGLPFIYTRHNEREESTTLNRRMRAGLMLCAARGAARVIAVSEAIRDFLERAGGVSSSRIVTIHNGIDLRPFDSSESREVLRSRFGWDDRHRIILMVAVIRKDKGHDVLFEAARTVMAADPLVRFKIVGDGPWLEQRRREAADLGDAVEFLGNRDDVPALLRAADLLVSPSRTEALPTAPIEAGATGLPVVATDVGGTREVVADGVSGFLVASGDAAAIANRILRLTADPALAASMGHAGYERVRRLFSLPRQASETLRVYEQVRGA